MNLIKIIFFIIVSASFLCTASLESSTAYLKVHVTDYESNNFKYANAEIAINYNNYSTSYSAQTGTNGWFTKAINIYRGSNLTIKAIIRIKPNEENLAYQYYSNSISRSEATPVWLYSGQTTTVEIIHTRKGGFVSGNLYKETNLFGSSVTLYDWISGKEIANSYGGKFSFSKILPGKYVLYNSQTMTFYSNSPVFACASPFDVLAGQTTHVEFAVSSAEIYGSVVDKLNPQKIISNVFVEIRGRNVDFFDYNYSINGDFHFENVPVGEYSIYADPEGAFADIYAPAYCPNSLTTSYIKIQHCGSNYFTIGLTEKKVTVIGSVKHKRQGVSYATVTFFHKNGSTYSTQTGSNGEYSISLPLGKFKTYAKKRGLLHQYKPRIKRLKKYKNFKKEKTYKLNFKLKKGAEIHGHVYEADGSTPISNIYVMAVSINKYMDLWYLQWILQNFRDCWFFEIQLNRYISYYTTTDTNGFYKISGLPKDLYKIVALEVDKDHWRDCYLKRIFYYPSADSWEKSSVTKIKKRKKSKNKFNLTYPKRLFATGAVSGRILDASSGAPIESVYCASDISSTYTDRTGNFSLYYYSNNCAVFLFCEGYHSVSTTLNAIANQDTNLKKAAMIKGKIHFPRDLAEYDLENAWAAEISKKKKKKKKVKSGWINYDGSFKFNAITDKDFVLLAEDSGGFEEVRYAGTFLGDVIGLSNAKTLNLSDGEWITIHINMQPYPESVIKTIYHDIGDVVNVKLKSFPETYSYSHFVNSIAKKYAMREWNLPPGAIVDYDNMELSWVSDGKQYDSLVGYFPQFIRDDWEPPRGGSGTLIHFATYDDSVLPEPVFTILFVIFIFYLRKNVD
jgi:uncharacterized protein YegP (UPF0339 family)